MMQLKRILMLLAAVFLLSACAARYDYANGIALRLREIKGDKYTADVWVDVAFENGAAPASLKAESIDIRGIGGGFSDTLIPWRDMPENVRVFNFDTTSTSSIVNKEVKLIIKNVQAHDKEYTGQWELPIVLKVDNSSVQYTAEPSPERAKDITFDLIEVCPRSLHFEAHGEISNTENGQDRDIELVLQNGEKYHRIAGSTSITDDNDAISIKVTRELGTQIDIDSAAALIFDGIEYTLTKAKGQ